MLLESGACVGRLRSWLHFRLLLWCWRGGPPVALLLLLLLAVRAQGGALAARPECTAGSWAAIHRSPPKALVLQAYAKPPRGPPGDGPAKGDGAAASRRSRSASALLGVWGFVAPVGIVVEEVTASTCCHMCVVSARAAGACVRSGVVDYLSCIWCMVIVGLVMHYNCIKCPVRHLPQTCLHVGGTDPEHSMEPSTKFSVKANWVCMIINLSRH